MVLTVLVARVLSFVNNFPIWLFSTVVSCTPVKVPELSSSTNVAFGLLHCVARQSRLKQRTRRVLPASFPTNLITAYVH